MIGKIIRSPKINAMTPPKLMPPFHKTAASGALPIEQVNDATAISGPIMGPRNFATVGSVLKNSVCHNSVGTSAPSVPEISRPTMISFQSMEQFITK